MIPDRRVHRHISARSWTPLRFVRSMKFAEASGRSSGVRPSNSQIPKFWRPAAALLLPAVLVSCFGDAQQTTTSSFTMQYEFKPQTPYRTDGLLSASPTVGLFIGVSDYGQAAKVTSTPAHSLGAAVMYEAFLGAVTSADNESLNLPADNYFKGGAEAICALAFSSDQSYFVSGSKDGTVTIWSGKTYGQVISTQKYKSEACAVAISPDSSMIAIGSSDGEAVIQPARAGQAPVTLKHPASICSAQFSPDGAKLLTTAQDGATRIWDGMSGHDPVVLQSAKCSSDDASKPSCADAPVAAFSPDGKTVATSHCGAIQLWSLDKPTEPVLLGHEPSPVHDVLFRPDGSQIMAATENGIALWTIDKTDGQQPRPAGDRPPDARVLAGAPLKRLQLSQDGQYALLNALDGNAWMQDLKGTDARIIPRQDRDNDGFTIKYAIDQGTIPNNRTKSRIEAVAHSPDASYVVAGYDDGSIGVHPGIKVPEQRPFREDSQFLLADLRFDNTPTSIMAIWYLEQLHGAMKNFVYEAPKDHSDDKDNPSYLRLGLGEPVTRERIFTALSKAIDRAEEVAELQQNSVLVVYVAAHGWIGVDGRQYFLPADADASNPATWIAYDEFLSRVKTFLVSPTPIAGHSEILDRAAVVIFDTCQTRLGSSPSTPAASSIDEPINLIEIEATSPGEYSWHWTGNLNSTALTTTDKSTKRFGITHRDKPKETDIKSDYTSRMSMFPYASQWALNSLIKYRAAKQSADDRKISLHEWIMNTQDAMDALQKGIPEVAETGQSQTIQMHNHNLNFTMFKVGKNAAP